MPLGKRRNYNEMGGHYNDWINNDPVHLEGRLVEAESYLANLQILQDDTTSSDKRVVALEELKKVDHQYKKAREALIFLIKKLKHDGIKEVELEMALDEISALDVEIEMGYVSEDDRVLNDVFFADIPRMNDEPINRLKQKLVATVKQIDAIRASVKDKSRRRGDYVISDKLFKRRWQLGIIIRYVSLCWPRISPLLKRNFLNEADNSISLRSLSPGQGTKQ